jgi:autotransporter passenger strand-loop-strand repeat protein
MALAAFGIAFLMSAGLGLRFKVRILLPAIGLAALGAMGVGVVRGDGVGTLMLTITLIAADLQIGYLLGLAMGPQSGSSFLIGAYFWEWDPNGSIPNVGLAIDSFSPQNSAAQSAATAGFETVMSGQTLTVSSGQTSNGLIVLGGGMLDVVSGGTISNTIDSGGVDNVSSGGLATGTTVSSSGGQIVLGGTASGTTVSNGGFTEVLSGGVDIDTTILSGGSARVSSGETIGGATNVGGGTLSLPDGAIVQGTLVDNGAAIFNLATSGSVAAALSGSGSLVAEGGGRLVTSGGAAFTGTRAIGGGGPIAFAGANATLRIDGTTMPADVISGLAAGDTIDLAGVCFVAGGRAGRAAGNVLQVVGGGQTHSLQLDPAENFSGDSFRVSSDGSGGTDISLNQGFSINITCDSSVTTASSAAAIEAAVAPAVQFYESTSTNPSTLNIDTGFGETNGSPISTSALAESGGTLIVSSGGTVINTVDSGDIDIVSAGGTATGTTTSTMVHSGGLRYIGSGEATPGGTVTSTTSKYPRQSRGL